MSYSQWLVTTTTTTTISLLGEKEEAMDGKDERRQESLDSGPYTPPIEEVFQASLVIYDKVWAGIPALPFIRALVKALKAFLCLTVLCSQGQCDYSGSGLVFFLFIFHLTAVC